MSSSAPQSACTRAISFAPPHRAGSSGGASEGDLEGGIELVTRDGYRVSDTRDQLNPDLKGCTVHQVAEVF